MSSPAEVAARLERMSARLPTELVRAQAEIGAAGVKIAQRWSSGGQSLAQLAADDHPYATRHGQYSGSALVNIQGGTFFGGWSYDAGRKAIVNPHGSRLQDGTPVMVGRDILGAIRTDLRPIARRILRQAVKRSLSA